MPALRWRLFRFGRAAPRLKRPKLQGTSSGRAKSRDWESIFWLTLCALGLSSREMTAVAAGMSRSKPKLLQVLRNFLYPRGQAESFD